MRLNHRQHHSQHIPKIRDLYVSCRLGPPLHKLHESPLQVTPKRRGRQCIGCVSHESQATNRRRPPAHLPDVETAGKPLLRQLHAQAGCISPPCQLALRLPGMVMCVPDPDATRRNHRIQDPATKGGGGGCVNVSDFHVSNPNPLPSPGNPGMLFSTPNSPVVWRGAPKRGPL